MKENIKIAFILLGLLSIISLYFFSIDQSIEEIPLCMLGYYEAVPSFLEISNLHSMSLVLDNTSCRLISNFEECKESLEEVDFELSKFKKNKSRENMISLNCCVESESDHPMCDSNISMTYNSDTGELVIKKNNTILANLVKDNMISLYL